MLIGQPTVCQALRGFTLSVPILPHQPRSQELYVTRGFSLVVIDDATKEVVYRDYIDISVAVATPRVCRGRRMGRGALWS